MVQYHPPNIDGYLVFRFSFTDPNSASFIPSGTHLFPIQRQLSGVKNMTWTLLFWKNYTQTYGWWFVRNPVNSPVEVGSLSHFMRFYTSQVVVWDFWTINSFPPKDLLLRNHGCPNSGEQPNFEPNYGPGPGWLAAGELKAKKQNKHNTTHKYKYWHTNTFDFGQTTNIPTILKPSFFGCFVDPSEAESECFTSTRLTFSSQGPNKWSTCSKRGLYAPTAVVTSLAGLGWWIDSMLE